MDLTTNGMTLPLLVAAGVAGALHWYTSRKPATPTPAPTPPAPDAGPLDWLSSLLARSKQLSALMPLAAALWRNHDAILAAVSAFVANIKKLITPDQPKGP